MGNIKVVSLDMFQTLVNVNSRIENIWRPILKNKFTIQLAEENAQLLIKYFLNHWVDLRKTGQFYLINEVYRRSFTDLFNEKDINYDPRKAVEILFEEHTLSHFYDETVDFLEHILQKYKVCIVSDADDAMIPDFYEKYGLQLFTSEQYQSYKNDEGNIMFKELLRFYSINPKQIIHIGDSASDIIGANREGILTCWINRNDQTWEHDIEPDYIVKSLDEIGNIL